MIVSSSGSSFVSGCEECDAVDENGVNTGSSIHYSKLSFEDITMIPGSQSFPSISGLNETGHEGNGAVKITSLSHLIDECTHKKRIHSILPLAQIIMLIYS